MKTLATTMGQDKRYFQFLWATSLTHDYVNNGRLGEALLLEFLQWMNQEGYLNNTVFVLMSDHGIRWGKNLKF
jgi:phosphoglycerol transferase MdoB-like AlkP superfamily enzyme